MEVEVIKIPQNLPLHLRIDGSFPIGPFCRVVSRPLLPYNGRRLCSTDIVRDRIKTGRMACCQGYIMAGSTVLQRTALRCTLLHRSDCAGSAMQRSDCTGCASHLSQRVRFCLLYVSDSLGPLEAYFLSFISYFMWEQLCRALARPIGWTTAYFMQK